MKIAVTGGSGCLGRPLVDKLINKDFFVKVLALPTEIPLNYPEKKVEVISGTLDSPIALKELCRGCDVVFHLAGLVHFTPGAKNEEQAFYQVNVKGTENVIRASKENLVKKIIFYSSVSVYGRVGDYHGDERSPCEPNTAYAKSKYLAEKLILGSYKNGGPEGVVLRFPVVYGPFDRGNVARLIRAVQKKSFIIFGDGNARRSMISSENASEAAVLAALESEAANNVFCVTDGRDYTMNELIEAICGRLGFLWRPKHIPENIAIAVGKAGNIAKKWLRIPFPIDTLTVHKLSRPLTFSCEKAKSFLGYKSVNTLDEGIAEEIIWLERG